jgi:hypothetical protein
MIKRVVAILAIVVGIAVHGRILVRLIFDMTTHEHSYGPVFLPAYSFMTSLILFGLLGIFDLNQIKNGKAFLWTLIAISATILMGWRIYIPIDAYFIGGIIFIGLNALPFMIRKQPNLNAITLTVNSMTIVVALFSFAAW